MFVGSQLSLVRGGGILLKEGQDNINKYKTNACIYVRVDINSLARVTYGGRVTCLRKNPDWVNKKKIIL